MVEAAPAAALVVPEPDFLLESLFRNSWPACKARVRSMTEAAERWSACSIATAAWPRTWRQPADRGVTWRSQGRWRRARPHRRNSETGSEPARALPFGPGFRG